MDLSRLLLGLSLGLLCAFAPPALAEDAKGDEPTEEEVKAFLAEWQAEYDAMGWQKGPGTFAIGEQAKVLVPEGYRLLPKSECPKWLELTRNLPDPSVSAVLQPIEDDSWSVIFSFDDCGYVKDDEKENLDADAILKSMQEGEKHANEQRRNLGMSEMFIRSWVKPPFYDPQTNNLSWAYNYETSGGFQGANFNTRLLGRNGVMSVQVLTDGPEHLEQVAPVFNQLLTGYQYNEGSRYGDFRQGDKMAAIGLTALIAGGAAALALKSGLLQKFGKVIIIGVIAVLAFVGNLFRSMFGKSSSSGEAA